MGSVACGLVGSSPLARGTRIHEGFYVTTCGLIPARAGNTWRAHPARTSPWAHPRSRGEHVVDLTEAVPGGGSSPLARGTRVAALGSFPRAGLIPARAGNTEKPVHDLFSFWAHPRSRGEHACLRLVEATFLGSSPLARGTPPRSSRGAGFSGLIPARAGNTEAVIFLREVDRAHPRSRGEHSAYVQRSKQAAGSSPLARGTHYADLKEKAGAGLIPARAGNTGRRSALR